ncbi:hypothetical protein CONPUDRAFT_74436 [Coniophora puteana RWD-64-598 SS2]|uniref:F-box domain-containing protein n=1 Tax=Coniophora puteana (strain RWD-64-598) TaxID=741705 RepID=A0A5M3MJN6_CONPW|nr:uncharacterized protein CONPUDRAFT_74436 [Coniophora puteana RWD-64-598 SS2]EIW78845.1 hypothetical protein CONPUDRAFT_74436 [Coniophora puteana RWD-64-598 SS2]
MHPALRLDEILLDVALHVPSNGDLLTMAQLCRSTNGPAIDVLWSNLPSIIPLVRSLPSDLVERTERVYCGNTTPQSITQQYKFTRPFTPADWAIFRRYSSRVIKLRGAQSMLSKISGSRRIPITQKVDPMVFDILLPPLSVQPLFSKLRDLTWVDSDTEKEFGFLRFLCSPSMTSLRIRPINFSLATWSLISQLGNMCPSITIFWWQHAMDQTHLPDNVIKVISNVAREWVHLRSLTTPILDFSQAFKDVSSFKSLQDLSTALDGRRMSSTMRRSFALPALSNLILRAPPQHSMETIATLIEKMSIAPSDTHSNVTLRALQELIGRLPDLESLIIAIDAERTQLKESDLEMAVNAAGLHGRNARTVKALFCLDLLDSRVSEPNIPIIAAFLSDLCINADWLNYWAFTGAKSDGRDVQNDASTQRRRWDEIRKLTGVMHQVRRQEKARWTGDSDIQCS